ncbi:hypothetical protein [Natronosalvus vescus]|uniref:hypothetical protein n=1 Tax=Natronosalvus vescus TaxID=2953881 RepID=UPI0020900812|nr:hypothetical protein [Natronosalvus vescus]
MNSNPESPSAPRTGVRGSWDRLVGPDTTRAENWLILGFAVVFSGTVFVYSQVAALGWNTLQIAIVLVISLDIAGGIIATTTVAGSRWWHRPSHRRRAHLQFIALHVHPFILAAVFPLLTWTETTIAYGFLLGSAVIVLGVPERLRRPIAMGLFAIGLLLALYVVNLPHGLEWFLPLLYLKLLPGHLVPSN